jgi:hypothetical protein
LVVKGYAGGANAGNVARYGGGGGGGASAVGADGTSSAGGNGGAGTGAARAAGSSRPPRRSSTGPARRPRLEHCARDVVVGGRPRVIRLWWSWFFWFFINKLISHWKYFGNGFCTF